MKAVTIAQAKAQFYKLTKEAASGEAFLISVTGKPVVKVAAFNAVGSNQPRRLGFIEGQISVPDDFDQMGKTETEALFGE